MVRADLLAIQGEDTAVDQLTLRRAKAPERAVLADATSAEKAATSRLARIAKRQSELAEAVAAAEDAGADLARHRARLEAQLKTVIAPREAEALMHELDSLAARRDDLDDAELVSLEEQSALADESAALEATLPELAGSAAAATAALGVVVAAIDAEIANHVAARGDAAARLDAGLRADYESRRAHFGGIAVAGLDGRRCTGCNLGLSTSEFEQVKATPDDTVADCPQCGRMLVA